MCDFKTKPSGKWVTRLYAVIFIFFSAIFVESILFSVEMSMLTLSGDVDMTVELLLVWLAVSSIVAYFMCYSFFKILAWAFRYGAIHADKFGDNT